MVVLSIRTCFKSTDYQGDRTNNNCHPGEFRGSIGVSDSLKENKYADVPEDIPAVSSKDDMCFHIYTKRETIK